MKNESILIERVMRRLLVEGEGPPSTEGLAVYQCPESGGIGATIYRPATLLTMLKSGKKMADAAGESVVAYVEVGPTDHPCNGAWAIRFSGGPSYGKLLYGIAYALTPNDLLTPDRKSVSTSAYNAWAGVARRVKGIPFDDVGAEKWEKMTPGDSSDDCTIHRRGDKDCSDPPRDPSVLNAAYPAPSWAASVLRDLTRSHKSVQNSLVAMGVSVTAVEKQIRDLGFVFWRGTYQDELMRMAAARDY